MEVLGYRVSVPPMKEVKTNGQPMLLTNSRRAVICALCDQAPGKPVEAQVSFSS